MKKIFVSFLLALIGLGFGCYEKMASNQGASSGPLYRYHFVGTTKLSQGTNAANLKKVLALPATAELREEAFQKISKAPVEFWRKNLPGGVPDGAAFIRPLLDDLLAAESYLEVRGPASRSETVLAIQLNDQRAAAWDNNLSKLVAAWQLGQPAAVNGAGAKGWEIKRKGTPSVIQFARAGQWVLVGFGQDQLTLLPALLEKTGKSGRPLPALESAVLDIEADCPRLGSWFPMLSEYHLPPTHLAITTQGEYLKTRAELKFSEKIPWTFEPWKIPTNMISEPIISFTVGQGLAPLLSQVKGVPELGLKTLPNQFCLWAQANGYPITFITLPVANATNAITQLAPRMPALIQDRLHTSMGDFYWVSNKAEIMWRKLPFIVPSLHTARDRSTEYLIGEMFPKSPVVNPPPPELYAQLQGRKDLLYYDWEITPERLPQANQLYQLADIVAARQLPGTNAPSGKWLKEIVPHLGNSITEVSLSSPKEITFIRKSHLGLTGFELATLARWVNAPGFPLKFEVPAPLKTRTNAPSLKKKP